MLPLVIPGEAIGIAGATLFRVSEAAQAAVGSVIGCITGANFVKELARGMVGRVLEINYQQTPQMVDFAWKWEQEDGATKIVFKRYRLDHLQKIGSVNFSK